MERRTAHQGFLRVEIVDFGRGEREMVIVPYDSVAALFYVPEREQVLLVRQQREAAISPDNADGEITAMCAGFFDQSVSIQEMVAREAFEELGATIEPDQVELLNDGKPMYSSVGILTERVYLTFAEIRLDQIEEEERIFGVAAEGEAISRVWMSVEEFESWPCDCIGSFAVREWFFGRNKGE